MLVLMRARIFIPSSLAALQVLSIGFALIAVVCMALAIAGMVRGDEQAAPGFALRAMAVTCFAIAVVLNLLR